MRCVENVRPRTGNVGDLFRNSAVTRARFADKVGSHLAKRVSVLSHSLFLDQKAL